MLMNATFSLSSTSLNKSKHRDSLAPETAKPSAVEAEVGTSRSANYRDVEFLVVDLVSCFSIRAVTEMIMFMPRGLGCLGA